MRNLFLITVFLAIALAGCHNQNESEEATTKLPPSLPTASPSLSDSLAQLVKLYLEYPLPLQLSTEVLEKGPGHRSPLAEGQPIPRNFWFLFGEYSTGEDSSMFAVAKLPLPSQKTGLLTRVPGMYMPSKIILFVFDNQTGQVTSTCEVAETFGDAGDVYVRTSNLSWGARQELSIVVSQSNCSPINENLDNITCTDSTLIYESNKGLISLITKRKKTQ
ncbi:hypothetical protein J0X19_06990 [Hymenobacter sp. BT186]|uniref:Lipoprotein n=1 Tax=Hymenobacter telluris TaxID=2816474 RepID=A0A939JBV1_9BACT|nr:hypothetical protein [Hymenobacter telluris]MBO0357685.1 hypothetical protein [Hymenobacter telluris]MBW3373712.1 hypothetical protein [Hymenobacter norwichensis]